MEHFVRVIFNKEKFTETLNESVFPDQNLLETVDGRSVIEIPLQRELSESESDTFADLLSNMLFKEGYDDFDIEISMEDIDEN